MEAKKCICLIFLMGFFVLMNSKVNVYPTVLWHTTIIQCNGMNRDYIHCEN